MTAKISPEGKIYLWVRPIERDIIWTLKIGTFRWSLPLGVASENQKRGDK